MYLAAKFLEEETETSLVWTTKILRLPDKCTKNFEAPVIGNLSCTNFKKKVSDERGNILPYDPRTGDF